MKKNKNEGLLIVLALMPALYLIYKWNELPQKVPVHWNIDGKIDRYGTKTELMLLVLVLPLSIYLLLTFIPKIDPKNQINKMGDKYFQLKFFLVLFMSFLGFIIIRSAETGEIFYLKYLVGGIGIFFMVFGNYMKTIKPNYFIGIRTPWTLENEEVWKKTHKITSYLWFWGGIIIVLASFLLPFKTASIVMLAIVFFIVIFPVIYSWKYFQKIKNKQK